MLLPLSHVRQNQQTDCLASCARMVLAYLQVPINYDRLLRSLETTAEGASFSKLTWLRSQGLVVTIGKNGSLSLFDPYIALGLPVIVAVQTEWLLYWDNFATEHAVVFVGIDLPNQLVFINDPNFDEAPQAVTLTEFDQRGPRWSVATRSLGWLKSKHDRL